MGFVEQMIKAHIGATFAQLNSEIERLRVENEELKEQVTQLKDRLPPVSDADLSALEKAANQIHVGPETQRALRALIADRRKFGKEVYELRYQLAEAARECPATFMRLCCKRTTSCKKEAVDDGEDEQ